MSFHITIKRDAQFLTSGHCGHGSPDEGWFHRGRGFIGSETASLYGPHGYDVMRVQVPDLHAADELLPSGSVVTAAADPIQGQAVCASLGRSDTVDCGTVTSDYASWTDGVCLCVSWGAAASGITVKPGDSGSPVYQLAGTPDGPVTAIGIMSTTSGKFARITDALSAWNATLVSRRH